MEGIVNFGTNVTSFLLTLGLGVWYVVRAYVPPNDVPDVHRIEQTVGADLKVMEVILLGGLNARLMELRYTREEDLATALADRGLVDMTAHFIPRRSYRGAVSWAWRMRREGIQVTGRGDYIIILYRYIFSNVGVR